MCLYSTLLANKDNLFTFLENGRVYLQRMADLVSQFLLKNENNRLYNSLLLEVMGILGHSYVPPKQSHSLLLDNSKFSL